MTNRNTLDDVDEDNVFVERSEPRCLECVLRAMDTTDCKLVGEPGLRSDSIHFGRFSSHGSFCFQWLFLQFQGSQLASVQDRSEASALLVRHVSDNLGLRIKTHDDQRCKLFPVSLPQRLQRCKQIHTCRHRLCACGVFGMSWEFVFFFARGCAQVQIPRVCACGVCGML